MHRCGDALQHLLGLTHTTNTTAKIEQLFGGRVRLGLVAARKQFEGQGAVFQLGAAARAALRQKNSLAAKPG